MTHQLLIVAVLVVLEGLLSADNALVLALLVRHLPKTQRTKALKYGIIGAFAFRLIAVLLATHLIYFWPFRFLGGLYLCHITWRHFRDKRLNRVGAAQAAGRGFWPTVVVVELTDIAFSIDSILAAVGLSTDLWVVYTGGVLGIIAMRFVAGGFLRLLDRFPSLESSAYYLVGWIGFNMVAETYLMDAYDIVVPRWLFWLVMLVLFGLGFIKREVKPETPRESLFSESDKEESSEK